MNDAKFAGIVINLASAGANATSSSILNTSTNDYYVTAIKAGCEAVGTSLTAYTGAGLSVLTLSVGTSTTPAPVVVPSNLIGPALTIATSSKFFAVASSTAVGGTTSGNTGNASLVGAQIWPAGSYMTFWFNATNTAICSVGVDVFSS